MIMDRVKAMGGEAMIISDVCNTCSSMWSSIVTSEACIMQKGRGSIFTVEDLGIAIVRYAHHRRPSLNDTGQGSMTKT